MKKYVIAKDSKVVRVVACANPSTLLIPKGAILQEVSPESRVRKGDDWPMTKPSILKDKKNWIVGAAIASGTGLVYLVTKLF